MTNLKIGLSLICLPYIFRKEYGIWWGCDKWWVGDISERGECKGEYELDSKTEDVGKCLEDLNEDSRDYDENVDLPPCIVKISKDHADNLGNLLTFSLLYINFNAAILKSLIEYIIIYTILNTVC